MRKVYVVEYRYYDDYEPVGVCATRRAAKALKERYVKSKNPKDRDWYDKHTEITGEPVYTSGKTAPLPWGCNETE